MSRTYVISGSASGIGAQTAARLRADGHTVVGVDLHDAEVAADLSTPEGRDAAVAGAIEASGGVIDAVIACAGLARFEPITARVNYFGAVRLLEGLRPTLAASAAPRAAVISSAATLQSPLPVLVEAMLADDEELTVRLAQEFTDSGPMGGYVIYPASKMALARWVRRHSITDEWAGAGIPLNAIGPGVVETPMTAELFATPESAAMVDAAMPMPLNHHMDPEAVAELLIYLTSEANTHVTGQMIYIDGGFDALTRGEDIWGANR